MRKRRTDFRAVGLFVLLLGVQGIGPPCASAASNAARGGIGGVDNGTLQGGNGSGQALVVLNVVDLALVKQARDLTGQPLPQGGSVAAGSDLWFVLYVDNPTLLPADSLQLSDALDETAFTYVPGSLAVATVPAGSTDAATWAAAWSSLTDAPGAPDDIASFVDTGGPPGLDRLTVGTVAGQSNRAATLPPGTRLALRFRVRVN